MYCSSCGKQIPNGVAFCSFCGASLNGTQGGAMRTVQVQGQYRNVTFTYVKKYASVGQSYVVYIDNIEHTLLARGDSQTIQLDTNPHACKVRRKALGSLQKETYVLQIPAGNSDLTVELKYNMLWGFNISIV